MKKKVKKILLTNLYSWKNKGDAAIVIGMIDEVKTNFPNSKISLSCYDPEDIEKKVYGNYEYQLNIRTIITKDSKNRIIQGSRIIYNLMKLKIFELFFKSGYPPYFLFSKEIQKKIKEYKKYDLIIACGGGYLFTKSFLDLIDREIFGYDFYLAHILEKQYILFNQSIGPFVNNFHFRYLKRFFKNANLIICREKLSFNRLNTFDNKVLSSDIAFGLSTHKTDLIKKYNINKKQINIGITVRKWLDKRPQEKYQKEIAKFITKLCKNNPSTNIYFLPQVIYSNHEDDDRIVSKKIIDLISQDINKRVKLISEDIHPSELKYIISKMNYFIGTRMHSNIFALSSGVKTIAISYEPKTIGIMNMLNLNNYVLSMESVSSHRLMKLFLHLKSDKKYIKKLQNKIPSVIRSSKNQIKICKNL
jgi:colanic acid/amylovoran biosynthesis protein WcaK/AmsJ